MTLVAINALSKPVAITEMLILIAIMAFIGWIIGRWSTQITISLRKKSISRQEIALDECRGESIITQQATTARQTVTPVLSQNLKVIEGIGPKIEQILNRAGIINFDQLAKSDPSLLNDILRREGSRFQIHDPATWPTQAALARDGKWEELNALQDKLTGGRPA